MLQHYKFHSGEKNFTCTYCSKSFTQNGDLKRHLKRHRSELPFHCSFCTDRFSDDVARQKHESVCPSRKFKCKICEFTTTENYVLKAHSAAHNQERRFKCTICPQNFRLKHHLAAHKKRHATKDDQEKKIVITCDICAENFKLKQQLTAHRKIHKIKGEIKTFKCHICDKDFSHECNLNTHMKYHNGDRPFACDQCPKCFVHKGDLGRHMKMHERQKKKNSNNEPQIQEIFVDEDMSVVKDEMKEEPLSEPDSEHDCTSTVDSAYLNFEPQVDFGEDSTNSTEMTNIKLEKTEAVDESKENGGNKWNNEEAAAVPCTEQNYKMENTHKSKLSNRSPKKRKSKSACVQSAKVRKVVSEKASKMHVAKVDDEDEKKNVKRFICDICTKCFRLKHHLAIHIRIHTDEKVRKCYSYCQITTCSTYNDDFIHFFFFC